MRPRNGKRAPRLDTEGNHFTVERHFTVRDGVPIGTRLTLRFDLELHRALKLPGVAEAIAHAEAQALPESLPALAAAEPERSTPRLRLIVDNTRGAAAG